MNYGLTRGPKWSSTVDGIWRNGSEASAVALVTPHMRVRLSRFLLISKCATTHFGMLLTGQRDIGNL